MVAVRSIMPNCSIDIDTRLPMARYAINFGMMRDDINVWNFDLPD